MFQAKLEYPRSNELYQFSVKLNKDSFLGSAVLFEGVGRVEGGAVGHTLHVDIAVDLLQLLRQVVTVVLRPSPASGGPDQHHLHGVSRCFEMKCIEML